MNDLKFSCPHCSQHIVCDAAWAGQMIQCPACQQQIAVPAAQSALRVRQAATPPPIIPPASPLPPKNRRKSPLRWVLRIGLACLACFLIFMGVRVVQFTRYVREHPRQVAPGEAEFREANRQIIANKGTSAFGNNRDAVALAESYSKGLKVLREDFFTKGKPGAFSVAKGEMLTYCQWNGDSCVFLVHVPELRRFTGDAKQSLTELAWANAQSVLKSGGKPPPKTVVVGLKGAVLYEAILVGDFVTSPKGPEAGLKTRGSGIKDLNLLYPFFTTQREPAPNAVK